MTPGRAASLSEALASRREEALLYRQLATLRRDVPLKETLRDLEWRGARPQLKELCHNLGDDKFPARVERWRST